MPPTHAAAFQDLMRSVLPETPEANALSMVLQEKRIETLEALTQLHLPPSKLLVAAVLESFHHGSEEEKFRAATQAVRLLKSDAVPLLTPWLSFETPARYGHALLLLASLRTPAAYQIVREHCALMPSHCALITKQHPSHAWEVEMHLLHEPLHALARFRRQQDLPLALELVNQINRYHGNVFPSLLRFCRGREDLEKIVGLLSKHSWSDSAQNSLLHAAGFYRNISRHLEKHLFELSAASQEGAATLLAAAYEARRGVRTRAGAHELLRELAMRGSSTAASTAARPLMVDRGEALHILCNTEVPTVARQAGLALRKMGITPLGRKTLVDSLEQSFTASDPSIAFARAIALCQFARNDSAENLLLDRIRSTDSEEELKLAVSVLHQNNRRAESVATLAARWKSSNSLEAACYRLLKGLHGPEAFFEILYALSHEQRRSAQKELLRYFQYREPKIILPALAYGLDHPRGPERRFAGQWMATLALTPKGTHFRPIILDHFDRKSGAFKAALVVKEMLSQRPITLFTAELQAYLKKYSPPFVAESFARFGI